MQYRGMVVTHTSSAEDDESATGHGWSEREKESPVCGHNDRCQRFKSQRQLKLIWIVQSQCHDQVVRVP